MQKAGTKKNIRKPQHQQRPGMEYKMSQCPQHDYIGKPCGNKLAAPGHVWASLIVSSFKPSRVAKFGNDAPMERAGQPAEIAPAYFFPAAEEYSCITAQVIHPNGGEIING